MKCGGNVTEGSGKREEEEDVFDPENRILCPDGTCTGIIIDGKCTECGKQFAENESKEG